MAFPDIKPSEEELLAAPDGLARLSGFLIRMNADKVDSDIKDGLCRISLHYNH
jgi:xanthine permease XanP